MMLLYRMGSINEQVNIKIRVRFGKNRRQFIIKDAFPVLHKKTLLPACLSMPDLLLGCCIIP